jgi:hypothetical protein
MRAIELARDHVKIYLDRNIFADVKRFRSHPRSEEVHSLLRNAVEQKRIRILLSTTILEETLPALKHSASTLREDVEVIRSLVCSDRMIKPPGELLREAVQSYALNRQLPDMLTRTPRLLRDLIKTGRVSTRVEEYLQGAIAHKDKFAHELSDAFEQARNVGQERNVGSPEDFLEFYNGLRPTMLEGVCRNYGVYDACLHRDIDGLLEIKTIQLYVLYYAAWAHAKWFGEQGAPGKVKASERGDFFHSVQAAACDVFVTGDAKLARWLKLIAIPDFEILTLQQLLDRLSNN